MIRAKDLKDNENVLGFRLDVNTIVELDDIITYLTNVNEEKYGLPIELSRDRITAGNFFTTTSEECIVITNTNHRTDYFKYVISLKKQGKTGIVKCYYTGNSELTYKKNKDITRSGKLFGDIANALFGVNELDLKNEYDYYNLLDSLIEALGK